LIEALENRLQTLAKESERPRVIAGGLAAPLHIVVLLLFSACPARWTLGHELGPSRQVARKFSPEDLQGGLRDRGARGELDSPSAGARPGRALVRFRPR
jgi:hypothetical protein